MVRTAVAVVAVAAVLPVVVGASVARSEGFVLRPLVTDRADAQLVNPWGLAAWTGGPWWVANEGRGSSTIYAGDGRKHATTVAVDCGPTGVVFHGGKGFLLHAGDRAAPARFLYACEDGTIRGWTPAIPPPGWSTETEVAVDAGLSGAVFRGLTLAAGRLYATDFHNAKVLVYDSGWRRILRRGAFVDPAIPAWFAPFGIQAIGGHVFVTYAGRAPVDGNDAPTGGYVDEFDLEGRLVAHVGTSTELDEPWGVALAPAGFGRAGGDLLVANFGSGRINAYRRRSGGWTLREQLPVRVPSVWGIAFGTGEVNGSPTTLFYTAGPHRWHGASEVDVHGVLGSIEPAA